MLKRLSLMLLLSLSFCLPFAVSAAAIPAETLRTFLTANRTLQAEFKQIGFDEAGRPDKTSYGMFYLQKPGKFRWEYQKPFTQKIVSNSGKVWFYDADLEQVTVKRVDQSLGSTPALLLSGEVSLERNFIITQQGIDGDMVWIRLEPKDKDTTFKYILIGLDKGQLGGMELSDNFGQLTRIYFSNVKTNTVIDPDVFVLHLPKGVDVLED
ncbi:MAG: outer membrane lipoprotein chaperone LolA [Gammaproteobacteria bacterium]